MFDARVIDLEGVCDPGHPNDRLLSGMKGSIFEFESGIIRARMPGALQEKARRGELRINVPVGHVWYRETAGPVLDPDLRVQETIGLIFARFREPGSARQVTIKLRADEILFPCTPGQGTVREWRQLACRNVVAILKNPFHAGACAWGKTGQRTSFVNGRPRKSSGHRKPVEQRVSIRDHHDGCIDRAGHKRNLARLAANSHGSSGSSKSGRGGRALLAGLLSCARCGRRLQVACSGGSAGRAVYKCRQGFGEGKPNCQAMAAKRVDAALAAEAIRVTRPLAVEAALEAKRMLGETLAKQRKVLELELQQARCDASLAERRHAACDPDNRLIAAQLETRREETLRRVADCEARNQPEPEPATDTPDFTSLADDLEAAWNARTTTMRARQQLLRTLIAGIVADADKAAREAVLVIHWRGGRHSRLRVPMPAPGRHDKITPEEAANTIRSMAGHWSDTDIAAALNRMRVTTAHGHAWTADRVRRYRREYRLPSLKTGTGGDEVLTLAEAADRLRVSRHVVRKLIRHGVLPARQAVAKAPWRTRAVDLQDEGVAAAAAKAGIRSASGSSQKELSMFSIDSEGDSQ